MNLMQEIWQKSVWLGVSARKFRQLAFSGAEVIISSGDKGSKPDISRRVDWHLRILQSTWRKVPE